MADKKELRKYKYTAVDVENKRHAGIMLAEDEEALRLLLVEQNLYLVKAKAAPKGAVSFFSSSSRVNMAEITTFCREFAIMINAGITIVNTLDTLKGQPYGALLKRALAIISEDVRSGMLLSEALKKHKKIFPDLFVSMTYVGEISGSLDRIMNELADYYENDTRIKRKTKSAMIYPTILAVLTVVIVALIFTFVIPKFEDTFNQLDLALPALTVVILKISRFCSRYWKELLLGLVVLILVIYLITRLEKVKYFLDYLKAELPLLRHVTIALISSRFARGFGALVSSGVDVVKSLDIMSEIVGNRYIKQKFDRARDDVNRGVRLSEAFELHKVFPDMLIQMLAIGESTGSLDSVISRTSHYFDEQVEVRLTRLAAILEPLIIIIMGLLIVTVILAVFLPILGLISGIPT